MFADVAPQLDLPQAAQDKSETLIRLEIHVKFQNNHFLFGAKWWEMSEEMQAVIRKESENRKNKSCRWFNKDVARVTVLIK